MLRPQLSLQLRRPIRVSVSVYIRVREGSELESGPEPDLNPARSIDQSACEGFGITEYVSTSTLTHPEP